MNISAEYLPIIISGAVFLFLVLVIAGMVMYVRHHAKKQILLGKIKQDAGGTAVMPSEVIPTQTRGGIQDRFVNFLGNIGERAQTIDKMIDYTKLRPIFLKAGVRRENARSVYWGGQNYSLHFFRRFSRVDSGCSNEYGSNGGHPYHTGNFWLLSAGSLAAIQNCQKKGINSKWVSGCT